MNTFLKNLFTRRVFNIIVGICALIWVIILTWGLIELALNGSVEEDGWRARLSSYSSNDDYDAEDYKTLSTDTVYGEMFHFKDALVVPLLEVDNTRKREFDSILNFKIISITQETDSLLFQHSQKIYHSELVQLDDRVLWVMEGKGVFYLYDSQSNSLQKVSYAEDYSIVYPKSLEYMSIEDEAKLAPDRDLMRQYAEQMNVYLVDNRIPSFTKIGNKILILAKRDGRENGRLYWIYDTDKQMIREIL